jgi:hypothetical protein
LYVDTWSGAVAYSLGMRFLGNSNVQHKALLGGVGTFSIPEVGPSGVPGIDWSFQGATFDDLFSDTRTTPPVRKGKSFAGSELKIAEVGNTTTASICGANIAFDLGRSFDPDVCGTDTNGYGLTGFSKGEGVPSLTVNVPADESLPSGPSQTHWREIMRDQDDDGFQILWNQGRVLGQGFGIYMPDCHLDVWDHSEIGTGGDGQTLVFTPNADTGKPQVIICQY